MTEPRHLMEAVDLAISEATGEPFVTEARRRVSGGDINQAFVLSGHGRAWFLKINRADRLSMFEDESAGLSELRQAVGLRVPIPVALDTDGEWSFLVMEHMELHTPTRDCMTRMGEALADMHGIVAARHGWSRDNMIGSNPQHNTRHASWTEFWRENRLAVMLDAMSPEHPVLARDGDRLLAALPDLLAGHVPEASLLHGDLWGGNAGMDEAGRPVIYDPAVYYGDRETDIALAELFGGFSPDFFEAYWGAWPGTPGYREIRRPLYQLYHLLNHARLFGGGYVGQSHRVIQQLLAAL